MTAFARRRWALLGIAGSIATATVGLVGTTRQGGPDPRRFEADVAQFEAADRTSPPSEGAVLFVGSSSIRYWDVEAAFPGRRVIKRGFGGSHVSDNLYFADRLIFRYNPPLIVFYAGDADVAGGKRADQIAADYRTLIAAIHARLPVSRTIVIGTKPSPAHWAHMETIRAANASVKALAESDPLVEYVDVEAALLGADGRPRADFYAENGLNLNERGYEAWNAAVRPVIDKHWPGAPRR
jgi:hypothetical protein